jgi:phosphoribosylformylglycinamidine cyclo-ligase
MLRTFNCGVGMVVIADSSKSHEVLRTLSAAGEDPIKLGMVVPAESGEQVIHCGQLDL